MGDCPDDVNSYIHRAGRTARYNKRGDALLMLLPSEEAMITHLTEKKIPITEIQVNRDRLFTIQRKLEAMLAKDVELKQVAQRSYVTYCKSIHLMKDKSVFDIQKLDLNALARSMGLSVAPRIRFYEKFLVGKNADAKVQAVKPSERWRSNAEEATFRFYDDEENRSSDSDDDILKMKRKDHELEEGSGDEIAEEKKKKDKHLTKEQAAKRIIRKKLTANKITNFDEEGNRVFDPSREKVSDLARALELEESSVSGINIEANKRAMMEEDKIDKEIHRQKIKARHREERLKAKEERRQLSQKRNASAETEEGDAQESDSEDSESLDGSVADIINALPDPDRIYGHKDDDDDDEEFYTGPTGPLAPKRAQMSASDNEGDSSDDDSEEVYSGPSAPRKRSQPSDSEDSDDDDDEPQLSTKRSKVNQEEEQTEKKKKWTRPKAPKKAKFSDESR